MSPAEALRYVREHILKCEEDGDLAVPAATLTVLEVALERIRLLEEENAKLKAAWEAQEAWEEVLMQTTMPITEVKDKTNEARLTAGRKALP